MIPCLDLKRQHEQVKTEVWAAFEKVYAQTAFSGGPFAEKFEQEFAAYCQASHSVALNNGTSALHLALLALGVGPGDEVILPANTFIATAWAVSYVGAHPVFVDCRADTWEIDAEAVRKAITSKTKVIIGVHLYGQPFDVDAIQSLADDHGIVLMEDSAQGHGAYYKGRRAGSLTRIACFSFYPGKNLGATGEGGGITTNDKAIADRIKSLRNHGSVERYYHDELGFNMRMGGLEAAALSVKLTYLDGWNLRRRQVAQRYQKEINNPLVQLQHQPEWADSVYHLFVVTTPNRDHFIEHLKQHGIGPALHYPVPCHLQKAYSHLGHKPGDFPNAEYLAAHCVSLPMFAELEAHEVDAVVAAVNAYKGL